MFALIPQLLMRAGWLVTLRGVLRGGWGVDVPGCMERCLREQPQGLKFPTPGVVLLFGFHLSSSCLACKEPLRASDGHGTRHEGPIVPTESMSLGLKVETNGLASSN